MKYVWYNVLYINVYCLIYKYIYIPLINRKQIILFYLNNNCYIEPIYF